MKTVKQLEDAFAMYFNEVARCEGQNCWWALLHLLVAMPDICAALDGKGQGAQRYVDWCDENFAANPRMLPGDRYQMRCGLLHQGTTLPERGKKHDTQYTSFSFTDPRTTNVEIHQVVNDDLTRQGKNCTVNIKALADETRTALRNWFSLVATDTARYAIVEANLKKLAMVKPKEWKLPPSTPGGTPMIIRSNTTSST
jgi:hypothetical protein